MLSLHWIATAAYAPAPVPTRTSGIRMAEDLNGLPAPLAGQTPWAPTRLRLLAAASAD